MASHQGIMLEALGPHAVRKVVLLTMMLELYTVLETTGILRMQKGRGREWHDMTW